MSEQAPRVPPVTPPVPVATPDETEPPEPRPPLPKASPLPLSSLAPLPPLADPPVPPVRLSAVLPRLVQPARSEPTRARPAIGRARLIERSWRFTSFLLSRSERLCSGDDGVRTD